MCVCLSLPLGATVYTYPRQRAPSGPAVQPSSTFSTDQEHTAPSKRTKTDVLSPFVNEYHHHGRQQGDPDWPSSHDSHVTSYQTQRPRDNHVRSHDVPHVQPTHPESRPQPHFNQSFSSDSSHPQFPPVSSRHANRGRESWSDLGRDSLKPHRPPDPGPPPISQARRGSLGGFSDDFNPLGPKNPSSSATGAVGEITQSQSSVRYLEVSRALQEQRLSRKRSSATSESDGNGTLDTEYQHLIPEDSQDELLTNQTETESSAPQVHRQQESTVPRPSPQLLNTPTTADLHKDSPKSNSAQDIRVGAKRPQQRIRSYEASRRSLKRPSELMNFRRSSSDQHGGGSSMVSSLVSRRCFSDSETREKSKDTERKHTSGSLHSSPLPVRNSPHLGPQTIPSWNAFTKDNSSNTTNHPIPIINHPEREEPREDATHQTIEDQQGKEPGEPMQVSPTNTHSFEMSDKLSDLSTSGQVGGVSSSIEEDSALHPAVENAVVQVAAASGSELKSLVPGGEDREYWSGQFGSGPTSHQAGNEQMEYEGHGRISGDGSHSTFVPADSDGQPFSVPSNNSTGSETVQPSSVDVSLQHLPNQPSVTPHWSSSEHRPRDTGGIDFHQPSGAPTVTTVYNGPHIMSPIAEASQEFSTQQTTPQTFSTSQTQHTQFTQSMHSLSPLPERTTEQDLNVPRMSTSPFRHNALGDTVATPLSPGGVSDNTNVSITSQVARVVDRSQTPQLEPPSTGSDTSRSFTRSSEVDTSTQPTVHYLPQDNSGLNISEVTPVSPSIVPKPHPLQSVPQSTVDIVERSSQVTPTPDMANTAFVEAERRFEHDHSALTSRGEELGGSISSRGVQSLGTHHSSVSEGNRERYDARMSAWSTTSAPVGYGSQSRQHRRVQRLSYPNSMNGASALSDNVAVQFRTNRRTAPVNQVGLMDHTGSMSQGRRRHRGNHGAPDSRHQYTVHRISQDLEMMTRAIEGMDSGRLPERGDHVTGRTPATREGRVQTTNSSSPSPSRVLSPVGTHGGRPSSLVSPPNRYHSNTDTRVSFQRTTRSSSVEPSSSHHRNGTRPLDSPGHPAHRDNPHNLDFDQSPNLHNSMIGLSQIPPNDESVDLVRHASIDLGASHLAQSGTPTQPVESHILSPPVQFPSAMDEVHTTTQPVPVVHPPPAGPDSFDYLPPYSPPMAVEQQPNQVVQRTAAVVPNEQQVYRDPPPSYEEIFGQQNGGRQRQRQRHPSRHSRNRQEEDRAQRGGEAHPQSNRSSHRSGSRSSGHRRLPSLTSLFKRSRRHSSHDSHSSGHRNSRGQPRDNTNQVPPSSSNNDNIGTSGTSDRQNTSPLQRTASWVASYNQTPRPITAYQQLEQGFRDFRTRDNVSSVSSTGTNANHSHMSRGGASTSTMSSHSQPTHTHHQLPTSAAGLPSYRHPPPFLHTSQDPALHVQRQPTYTTTSQDTNTQRERNYLQDPLPHPRRQMLLVSPSSHTLVHTRSAHLNLSQPNIPLLPSSQDSPYSSGSSSQAPLFRRVLAHPPRTRPMSSLVTSSEYGRVGSSMTSVNAMNSESNETRTVLSSAIERLRNDERQLERPVLSGPGDQQWEGRESQQPYLPWQLDTQRDNEDREANLASNGNANNDNPSPSSPYQSPNATPTGSPVMRRRPLSVAGEEGRAATNQQSQTQTSENVGLQNGNEIPGGGSGGRRVSGDKSNSQRSTTRIRAARRLTQGLSSSDDEIAGAVSSSSSQGRARHRRKRGDGSSRSSSRNQSQSSTFVAPVDHPTPLFFPSFQSQTTELFPDSGILSALSNTLTLPSTVATGTSHDSHVMSQRQSQEQQVEVVSRTAPRTASQPAEDESHDQSRDHAATPVDTSHGPTITSEDRVTSSHDQPTPGQSGSRDHTDVITSPELCGVQHNNTEEQDSGEHILLLKLLVNLLYKRVLV